MGVRAVDRLGSGNYHAIARRAGLTAQHVSRVLRGTKGASFHIACRIADAAGVTLDDLRAHIYAQPSLLIRGRRTLADTVAVAADRPSRRRPRRQSISRSRPRGMGVEQTI